MRCSSSRRAAIRSRRALASPSPAPATEALAHVGERGLDFAQLITRRLDLGLDRLKKFGGVAAAGAALRRPRRASRPIGWSASVGGRQRRAAFGIAYDIVAPLVSTRRLAVMPGNNSRRGFSIEMMVV